MMRLTEPARIGVVLALLAAGCPRATPTTIPASAPPASDPRIGKLARILRASDRRIVDDDLRALMADGDIAVRTKAILALARSAIHPPFPIWRKRPRIPPWRRARPPHSPWA
jgi:hypothetical protein